MLAISRPRWDHYLFTIFACLAALAITLAIPQLRQDKHTLLFLAAVTVSAWVGGWQAGLLAVILSIALYAWKVMPPVEGDVLRSLDLWRVSLFTIVALLLNSMHAARDRAETLLRGSQDRLTFALDAARMGAWELEVDTGDFWTSPNLPQVFGRRSDRFARSYEAFLGYIHPEDRDRVVGQLADAVRDGGDWQAEHRIVLPDRSTRWIMTRCRTFQNASGQVRRLVGIAIDVTDQHDHRPSATDGVAAGTPASVA